MSEEIIRIDRRLNGLMDDDETLYGKTIIDETDEGWYVLVARGWDHPEVEGTEILSERFAYLTKGEGGDCWVDWNDAVAINRRDVGPDGATAQALAEMYAAIAARQRNEGDEWEPFGGTLLED